MESTFAREEEVKTKPLPGHVGIIMDGNGRWAEGQGRRRLDGHREGSQSVREVTRCARRLGLKALTLYAFSSQNWARPLDEVTGLMALLAEFLSKEREEIMTNGIRLNAIGQLDKLPVLVRGPLEALRKESRGNKGMVLSLALSYGGREELVSAARTAMEKAKRGELDPSKLDADTFETFLWTADLPPVDLVIRTSGEKRISNFLLWQSAYAEYVFADVQWPDFRAPQLLDAISEYQRRDRRFGLTGAQAKPAPP
ncbi:MAG: di-trans,poly-cis-decaprenylcistransferase [Myxococcaceae bacterium]|nr:di-trans,poly-cis-decaprenylcistransferase [Myxococcaceae bacterium]